MTLPPIDLILGEMRAPNLLHWEEKVRGRSILVTGAGGFIGSHLCERLASAGPSCLVLVENNEFALYKVMRSLESSPVRVIPVLASYGDRTIAEHMRQFKVDMVVHAGAHKHVPLVERNPVMGVKNNVLEFKNLLCAVEHAGAQLLVVSSDKAVNPTNVMGATKQMVEALAAKAGVKAKSAVRFGNVMWSSGSVLNVFHEQLLAGKPITLTHEDVDRFFMTVEQAVGLILQTLCIGQQGIFALDMGQPLKIKDVAMRLADAMGVKNVEFDVVGLRPGEKLHEEVCLGSNLTKTIHPEILEAGEGPPKMDTYNMLRELEKAVDCLDASQVRVILQKYVLGYDPQCGIVEDLWLEANVKAGYAEVAKDDCFEATKPAR